MAIVWLGRLHVLLDGNECQERQHSRRWPERGWYLYLITTLMLIRQVFIGEYPRPSDLHNHGLRPKTISFWIWG